MDMRCIALGLSPEEFGAFVKAEIAKWAKVVRLQASASIETSDEIMVTR